MSAPRAEVRLVPDGGAAAVTGDFFRSSGFLRAEGTTHSLIVSSASCRTALPLIVRPVPGTDDHDAVSPYGYPGGVRTGPPLDPNTVDFSESGLVSIFVRERVSPPTMLGGTRRSDLQVFDPRLPRAVSATFARHVRRNERAGFVALALRGPEVDDDRLEAFRAAYHETMDRAGASDRYYFSSEYLRSCLSEPGSWFVAVHAPDGALASASIVVLSDDVLHYYLGGTTEDHRPASPAKNGFVRMMDLAEELDVPLNLGGGLAPGDGLERFKRSFANSVRSFLTHEIVADHEAYATLAPPASDPTAFFPAYRA
jgi:hypothetical protein